MSLRDLLAAGCCERAGFFLRAEAMFDASREAEQCRADGWENLHAMSRGEAFLWIAMSVPGCLHAAFIDANPVQARSEGGRHEASNLLTVCSAQHRAVHRDELLVGRGSDGALRFSHADGAFGSRVAPRDVDANSRVSSALRHLGFREKEAQAVRAELRADPALREATVERLLREALRRIKPMAR